MNELQSREHALLDNISLHYRRGSGPIEALDELHSTGNANPSVLIRIIFFLLSDIDSMLEENSNPKELCF
tara:strand:- start:189 stop:398 length:210 start_codon:yes stop_codon:yes gene_type:complete